MLPNQAQTLVGFEIFVQHNKLSAMSSVATVVFINFLLLNDIPPHLLCNER
jgi:hypothetical protein